MFQLLSLKEGVAVFYARLTEVSACLHGNESKTAMPLRVHFRDDDGEHVITCIDVMCVETGWIRLYGESAAEVVQTCEQQLLTVPGALMHVLNSDRIRNKLAFRHLVRQGPDVYPNIHDDKLELRMTEAALVESLPGFAEMRQEAHQEENECDLNDNYE